jgi:regulator of sigma E protease
MNVVLAWVLLSAGFMAGMPTAVESMENLPKGATLLNPHVGVLEVLEKSPAQAAGLMPDDLIVGVDGQKFYTASGFQEYIRTNKGKVFDFNILRGGEEKTVRVESLANPGENQGPTGIVIADVGNLKFTPLYAVFYGAKATGLQLYGIGKGLVGLFSSGLGLKALGGPVKIAQVTGRAAEMGYIYLLQFTAFLSLNLAILNILPFPALDGGRVLFLIIEKIRGVRNNPKVEQAFNAAGFALLILLMILVTIKDVRGI